MLTSDLLRIRKVKNEIKPRYIDVTKKKYKEKAQQLIELYDKYVHRTRGELEEAIREVIGDGTDFLMQRGLAKLLTDRSEFEVQAPVEPKVIREKLFTLSAQHYPIAIEPDLYHTVEREHLIAQVADELGVTAQQIEHAMYADLQDAYVLQAFESLTAEQLLHRYNLALAQAVLFKATQLQIELHQTNAKRLKQLVRYLKFFRLIAEIEPIEEGYRFKIDGPLSMFRFCQKYGLQMASFLPALLLCEDWQLAAELRWDHQKTPTFFFLESDGFLKSHYPDKGVYVTEEEKYFRKRWDAKKLGWELKPSTRIVRLGSQGVSVTDYVLKHPDGREVLLELVGFWNRSSMIRKIEQIQEHGPSNMILAAPGRLRVSQEDLSEKDVKVYFFKDVILPKRIVALAEALSS